MKLLIVDDDELIQLTMKSLFDGEEIHFASSVEEANLLLSQHHFHAALLDIQLKKGSAGDGIELLRLIRERDPYLPCIMISALDDKEIVERCLELGALDYVAKGTVAPEAYKLALHKAAVWRKVLSESPAGRIPQALGPSFHEWEFKGQSPKAMELRQIMWQVGSLPGPFLIQGETGTGKELVARSLWAAKKDPNRPFVAINCASLPESLVESELFGYEKGAFTGATAAKTGLFEAANGGDLFLDEMGELSQDFQAKFLRVLQEKKVRRVGGDKERPIDIRIIAATNLDLAQAVEQKEFREDLFYRLNVQPIRVPSLRERPEDILYLLRVFLDHVSMGEVVIERAAEEVIKGFEWPGNVRQLKAFVEFLRGRLSPGSLVIDQRLVESWMHLNPLKVNRPLSEGQPALSESAVSEQLRAALVQKKSIPVVNVLDGLRKAYVETALQLTGNNRTQAAKLLGLSRQRLSNWLNEWGMY